MAIQNGRISTDDILDSAITTAKIKDDAVESEKIGANEVLTAAILDGNITNGKLGTDISAAKLTAGTVPDARFPATLPALNGSALTTLNATNLASGTVATARLGTGTANSTTFLRGDSTYAAPSTSAVPTNRNLMINGAMEVSQKGGGSHAIAAATYWIDRFYTYTAAAGRTISQTTDAPDGFKHSIKLQRDVGTTPVDPQYFSQPAESASCVGFAGEIITLSFWARKGANFSPASDYINVGVYSGTGTDQSMMGGLTDSALVIGTTNQAITADWVRYTFTSGSAVPTTSNQLVFQILTTPVGTAGANDWYEITGVQLEIGSAATDFVHEEYGTTLAKCQRFFLNYVQGHNKNIGTSGFYNTTTVSTNVTPPVTFREAPTMAFGSGSDWYLAERNGASVTGNLTTTSVPQENSVGFYGNSFGTSTSGHTCWLRTNNAGAYIWFDAEL